MLFRSKSYVRRTVYFIAHSWLPQLPAFLVELYGAYRVSARLSGRAKGTKGSVSVPVNRHEELSDRSAPYVDFGHGSLFEGAPGARQFCGATELSARFHFMPIDICMENGALHAVHILYYQSARSDSKQSGLGLCKNLRLWTGTLMA